MSTALLDIENLRVQYGRLVAVDGLSLELHAGHLLGLIGPNGAGKTTTLRAAAGLQPLTTGRVRLLGHDVFTSATIVNHHLGFTPDTPALYDTLTAEDYLRFIAKCYDLSGPQASERIDHWLENLWLSDKRAAKISTLSRGMRQRLAVARTLLPDPHVVLMDEPAAGLDPAGRVQFRQLLANLRDQRKAILVSSHILADLAEYCTHIAIMGHGKLLQYGSVAEVAGAESHERTKYRIVLAERVGDLATRLERLRQDERVARLEFDADLITLEYDSDRQAATTLLRKLLAAGLPVAEFHTVGPDLEQAYLRAGIRQVD
ncbi:MAG: ABC transporter ATP-binding protein [Phycisphaerae bacterium]